MSSQQLTAFRPTLPVLIALADVDKQNLAAAADIASSLRTVHANEY
jgi:hypothetical protein|tara:strand:- start:202 stop:339 length:138 start_codon:yes stop_codon:yes gene_type:complete